MVYVLYPLLLLLLCLLLLVGFVLHLVSISTVLALCYG